MAQIQGGKAVSAIECLTSSTATKVDVTLLDKESGDVASLYSIGLDLQKENDALKQRIKRLEEELMDMKNKHAVLVADVALYEDRAERIKRLEEAGDALENDNYTSDNLEAWRKAKEDKL